MARIRTIKPDFCEDEEIAKLPIPVAHLFVLSWMFADDDGVLRANPIWLKSKLYPLREDVRKEQVAQWIECLVKARFLVPFNFNAEGYYVIRTFRRHQRIDKPQPSKIPKELVSAVLEAFDGDSENIPRTLQERSHPDKYKEWNKDKEEDKEKTNAHTREGSLSEELFPFDAFWEAYQHKVDRKVCERLWAKLGPDKRQACMEAIPAYVASTPLKPVPGVFTPARKNPETYLRRESWTNTIIEAQHANPAHLGSNTSAHRGRSNPTVSESLQRARDREASFGITGPQIGPGEQVQPPPNPT